MAYNEIQVSTTTFAAEPARNKRKIRNFKRKINHVGHVGPFFVRFYFGFSTKIGFWNVFWVTILNTQKRARKLRKILDTFERKTCKQCWVLLVIIMQTKYTYNILDLATFSSPFISCWVFFSPSLTFFSCTLSAFPCTSRGENVRAVFPHAMASETLQS